MKTVPFCSHGEEPEQPQVIEKNGRPVETRTPDLYRVKGHLTNTLNNLHDAGAHLSTWKYV
jgi:hypothetical protein